MEMGGSSDALDVSAPTHDLKFMLTSNVNASNFVSVKLSGTSNYKIWKEQMLCLLKSQALLYIVDVGCPSPGDKGVNPQYDQLVKGWIFGSVNEKVLRDLIDSSTAQEVWMKLESLFSPAVSYTEGDSSNAPDVSTLDVIAPVVSAMREDLKYLQALNVDVSNFVSEKLEGFFNYYTWKNEMLSLIRSHELLHIIHAEDARLPWDEGVDPMTQKYNSLVRGWILNTMDDYWCDRYRIYRSVKEMWRRLESTLTYKSKTSESDAQGIMECKADDSSNATEDLKYMQLKSNVNVYDFVSVKLSGRSNYNIWKDQMLRLLESHSLLHIINEFCFEEDKYHKLVNGWLFCTMNDELHKDFPAKGWISDTAKYLWGEVESRFTKGYSRPEPVVSASTQDLKYTQALNVNVSNFVSVKLSGHNNYEIWKGQMLNLIESQKLLHIIDKEGDYKVDEYDTLVKGWIFSTMNEQLLSDLTYTDDLVNSYNTAKDVWETLTSAFDRQDPQEVEFGVEFIKDDTESESDLPESDNKDNKRSYKAFAEGWLRKAKSIFNIHKNVATEATTANDNTILHVAVETENSGTEVLRDIPDIETEGSLTEVVRDTPHIETESSRIESIKKELHVAATKGWWRKAKSILKINKNDATEAITPDIESVKKELYKAAAEGLWRKAKSILKTGEIAHIESIAANGNTILHVAVEMGHNYFVEELLEFLENLEDIEKTNVKGQTALHIAAMVDNTRAAQLLVRKRKNLVEIKDGGNDSPLDLAIANTNLNVYAYLFKSTTPSDSNVGHSYYRNKSTLLAAIYSKKYDLAEELLKTFPFDRPSSKDILMALTVIFPTNLGFMETFIYPSFHNVRRKIAVRGSLLFHPDRCVDDILRIVNVCNNTCDSWLGKNSMTLLVLTAICYPIYQLICLFILMLHLSFSMLYLLLWKVLTVTGKRLHISVLIAI